MYHTIKFLLISSICVSAQTVEFLDIAVLVPNNDYGCTKKAIEMAFRDVQRILKNQIHNPYVNKTYELKAHYLKVSKHPTEVLLALYKLFFQSKAILGLIGPPFDEHGRDCANFISNKGTVTVSYSQTYEPLNELAINYHQTSPHLVESFRACYYLMKHYNWRNIGVLADLGSDRYREMIPKLVDTFTLEDAHSDFIIKISMLQSFSKIATEAVSLFHASKIRIIVTAMSLQGARSVFCEAYKNKMRSPTVVWVLFEVLPSDWASDKYNSGELHKREIQCTEDQLNEVASGYIAITRQSIRQDSVKTISEMTADEFKERLHENNSIQCNDAVAHAYDAVWGLALAHKEISQAKPDSYIEERYNNDIYAAYRTIVAVNDTYAVGSALYFGQEFIAIKDIQFEGLTGYFKFYRDNGAVLNRKSELSIWTNSYLHNRGVSRAGIFNHTTKTIFMNRDIEKIMFVKGEVPKDKATYVYLIVQFNKELVLVFWIAACLGMLIALAPVVLKFCLIFKIDSVHYALIFGCFLCHLSVIAYSLDTKYLKQAKVYCSCYAFLIILSLGFTFGCGSLLVRAWIMYKNQKAFTNGPALNCLRDDKTSRKLLAATLLLLVVIDAVIISTWVKFSPFSSKLVEIDSVQDVDVITVFRLLTCTSKKETQFMIAICCYKGVLLFLSMLIAWQIDRKNLKSDSKPIKIAIYNVTAMSIIVLVCSSVLKDAIQYEAKYAVTAVCIIVCATITPLLVFFSKIRKAWKLKRRQSHDTKTEEKPKKKKKDSVYSMSYLGKDAKLSVKSTRYNEGFDNNSDGNNDVENKDTKFSSPQLHEYNNLGGKTRINANADRIDEETYMDNIGNE